MTWLRNHKQAKFEASVEQVSEEFKAEPDWVIDQMLKRKRDEVIKRWEEREARLARVRAKERAQEIRGAKRRRLDEAAAHAAEQSEDEDEWLLEDREDQGGQADPHSGYSKETRALMEKVGMISKRDEAEEDDVGEQEIKVRQQPILSTRRSQKVIDPICRSTTPREHILNSHSSFRSCAGRLSPLPSLLHCFPPSRRRNRKP